LSDPVGRRGERAVELAGAQPLRQISPRGAIPAAVDARAGKAIEVRRRRSFSRFSKPVRFSARSVRWWLASFMLAASFESGCRRDIGLM
jgi:hypothetical protein